MRRWLLLFGTLIGCANAGPVTWYLQGVHYFDNSFGSTGYSVGQFTYDADTNALSGWSITDLGKPQDLFPSSWGPPSVCPSCVQSPTSIEPSGMDSGIEPPPAGHNNVLHLFLAQPLTDAGGTIALVPFDFTSFSGSIEFFHQGIIGQGIRYLEEGSVSTNGPSNIPEPSTFSGVLLTLICVGVLWARKAIPSHAQRDRM